MQIDRSRESSVIRRLSLAGCVAAQEEAGLLLRGAPDDDTLEDWVQRRERGEPLAWITGMTTFCGRTIRVDRGVYVPRRQSEELARRAGALLPRVGGRAVDLCTGSGAIAAHLASVVPGATVIGTDLHVAAVCCAGRNGVVAVVADLGGSLRGDSFDVVTAVAPYVPAGAMNVLPADVRIYEPILALDGGDDGLDVVRRVAFDAARLLRDGGWLLTELGGEQAAALEPTLAELGYARSIAWFDDDGDLRGVMAQMRDPNSLGMQE